MRSSRYLYDVEQGYLRGGQNQAARDLRFAVA